MKDKKKILLPELIAPAGDWPSLLTAIEAGADAVYFGVTNFNMRAEAENFQISELKKVMALISECGKKGYLALNTIIFDREFKKVGRILDEAKRYNVNAVIAWDNAVIQMARERRLPVHLSTQASAANSKAAAFYSKQGINRIVFARECGLEDILAIRKELIRLKCPVEIETFIHGAQCVSISGRCFLSHISCGRSANRGECIQPCRQMYNIKGEREGVEYNLGRDYILSAKDLCTVMFIDKLIEAGINAFKIEGRMRSPEYIKTVVSCYRRALDAYSSGKLSLKFKEGLLKELKGIFNRGFSNGFYLGVPDDTGSSEGAAEVSKIYLGEVVRYFAKINVAAVRIRNASLNSGANILIYGKNTPALSFKVSEFQVDRIAVSLAQKGQTVSFKVPVAVHLKDKVFLIMKK